MTEYFLSHLPEDLVPYWDFEFTDGSDQPRDSSAAVIAACGMLEMAKYVDQAEADQLISDAKRMIKALYDHCAVKDPKISNGQLLNSTYCRSTPTNGCRQHGVDECCSWGRLLLLRSAHPLKQRLGNVLVINQFHFHGVRSNGRFFSYLLRANHDYRLSR